MKRSLLVLVFLSASGTGAQMLPKPGTLVIQSVPSGAPVTLNGSASGQSTDLSLAVSPGSYSVSVGNPGGKPFCAARQISVAAGQRVVLVCTESGWGT
jgi:hypothetical protein